jgi:RNA polymerase primary sigma factor
MHATAYANEELAWSTAQALEVYLGQAGTANQRLARVARSARSRVGCGVPLLDLLQEGVLALGAGADVDEALRRASAERTRTVKVPVRLAEQERALGRAEEELTGELGRAPHEWELADRAGLTLAQARAVREAVRGAEGEELRVALDEDALAAAAAALPEQERAVIETRYGIAGATPHTLAETAQLLELPRAEILAIEAEALERLAVEREIRALRG